MRACASVPATAAAGVLPAEVPIILVDSVPEPRLSVRELSVEGPLDVRRATLDASLAVGEPALLRRWQRGRVAVAAPLRLTDERVRWHVLAHGRLQRMRRRSAEGVEDRRLELVDDWTQRLERALPAVWWATAAGSIVAEPAGVLRPGPGGGRSAAMFTIAGRAVHVLEAGGGAWTVGAALASVAAFAGLELSTTLVPGEVLAAALLEPVDLGRPMGEGLRRILEPYGLVIQRDLIRDGASVSERLGVRPTQHGRAVRLRWAGEGQAMSDALRVEADAPAEAAQLWVARGAGWRVESTFGLVGGWDPGLEGAPDAAYDRAASDDFARYANVYRRWVLNEDGHFTAEPYDRGPAFDLGGLFGQGAIRPRPLRFGECLTLDDAGAPRPAVVEMSTDGGASWSRYPGRASLLDERAGVVLEDDALPAAFLSAAKSGAARVRVTARLDCPEPVEVRRWRGNAFAGTRPARVFELGEAFAFRRVDGASVHHVDVRAGVLKADEVDASRALAGWLIERMRRAALRGTGMGGRGRVELSGAWPMLRIGDRLTAAGGAGVDPAGRAEAAGRRGVVVTGLRCRFGVEGAQGPRTTVEVG